MEILHISTYDIGGAGTAAIRLHKSLLKEGINSSFLCLKKFTSDASRVYEYNQDNKIKYSFTRRALAKLGIKFKRIEPFSLNFKKYKESFEIFTSPITGYNEVHLHPLVKQADIIHLHWIADFIDYPSFFKKINKPIIWTLHDFNPDQGGFHLKYDQENCSIDALVECEKKFQRIKRDSLKNCDLTIVSPSQWFYSKLTFDVLPINTRKEIIMHGIESQDFKPLNKGFSREVLNISFTELVFVCVASDFNRKSKGFEILISALDKLAEDTIFTLLVVGGNNIVEREYVKNIGHVDKSYFLSVVYSAADAFVTSSLEESFCLTAAEALFCGIPVISTNVGFMANTIRDGFQGFLDKKNCSDSFYETLKKFISHRDNFSANLINRYAQDCLSIQTSCQRYIKLYKAIA